MVGRRHLSSASYLAGCEYTATLGPCHEASSALHPRMQHDKLIQGLMLPDYSFCLPWLRAACRIAAANAPRLSGLLLLWSLTE